MMEVNYDNIAGNYDANRNASPRVVAQVIDRLGDHHIKDILEVGSGTANHLLALTTALTSNGYGLDLSMPMLQAGRQKNAGLKLIQADAAVTLPFPDASFDLVCSIDFIHYLRELTDFYSEVFRVLRPGGFALTATDSSDDILDRTQTKYFPETVQVEMQRYHSISAIVSAMGKTGFESIELSHTEHRFIVGERHLTMSRNKAFSCLRLIPEQAFQAGLARLTADVRSGNCIGKELYTYAWGSKPIAVE